MDDMMTAGMYERQYLEQLYHQLYQGMMDKDEALLGRVLADDFVLYHMTGMQQSKEEFIAAILDGTLNYYAEMTQSIAITPLEDHAEILGRSRVAAAVFGGKRGAWDLQLKCELRRGRTGWQFVSARASTF
ncbi:MAG: nuclear transport factor 2 family protein [Firmicutes bacterium]|nr:nuclear transport factor 2 family protein [Bacillota bacterium]